MTSPTQQVNDLHTILEINLNNLSYADNSMLETVSKRAHTIVNLFFSRLARLYGFEGDITTEEGRLEARKYLKTLYIHLFKNEHYNNISVSLLDQMSIGHEIASRIKNCSPEYILNFYQGIKYRSFYSHSTIEKERLTQNHIHIVEHFLPTQIHRNKNWTDEQHTNLNNQFFLNFDSSNHSKSLSMCQVANKLLINNEIGNLKALRFIARTKDDDLLNSFLERDDIIQVIENTNLSLPEFLIYTEQEGSIRHPIAQKIIRDFYFTCECDEVEDAIGRPSSFIIDMFYSDPDKITSIIRSSYQLFQTERLVSAAASKGCDALLKLLEDQLQNLYDTPAYRAFNKNDPLFDCLDDEEAIKFFINTKKKIENSRIPFTSALEDVAKKGYSNVLKQLLEYSEAKDNMTNYGWKPLHYACLFGHVEAVRKLLKAGFDANALTNVYNTPLHIACIDGNIEIIKLLINAGANFKFENTNKETPLSIACQQGHLDIVKFLCNEVLNNKLFFEKQLPIALYDAYENGHEDIIEFLQIAFYTACESGHEDVVEFLLSHYEYKSVFNSEIDYLYAAASSGKTSIINMILNKDLKLLFNASKNQSQPVVKSSIFQIVGEKGYLRAFNELLGRLKNNKNIEIAIKNTFIEACKWGKAHIVKALFAQYPDMVKSIATKYHRLTLACDHRLDTTNSIYNLDSIQNDYLEIVQLFIEYECPLNNSKYGGASPLYFAAAHGHLSIVKALIDAGADLNTSTSNLNNPLFAALTSGHIEVYRLLLDHGVQLHNPKATLNHLLVKACNESNLELAQMLIDLGADMNTPDMHGRTLMDYAIPSCIWSQLNF